MRRATSVRCGASFTRCGRSALKACISTIFGIPANTFAAAGSAGIKDLMARMGHDSERAALIYQHQARGADKIVADNLDVHVETERNRKDGDDGAAGALVLISS
jgi:hypothetical protein